MAARPRVVLVQPSADNSELAEAPTRIRAELEAAGFDVEIVEGDASLAPRDQLDRIGQQGALGPTPVAAIVLASAGTSADIWIADRVTAKTTVRRIDIAQTSQAASILAVRTVELLRASLLETQVAQASQPPAAKVQPQQTSETTEPAMAGDRSAAIRIALELGATGLFSMKGLSPKSGPALRVSVGTLSVNGRLTLAAPIFGERLEKTQGSAIVQPFLGQLDVVASLPLDRIMRLYGSLGFGGYVMPVRGKATAPAIAHDATATGALLQIGAGLQVNLAPQLSLFIEPQLIWFLPDVAIRIADRQVARIGQPAIGATVGLTWTF